ncbi:MAG: (2Fe-2S)-binding protein [Candidatus Eremiobacteraeota bacterium]|nr:(2Fe-2S)-binding protein [Candidatus Eremiobacteraeota bacterium]
MDHKINLTVNGHPVEKWIKSSTTLLDFLRNKLDLTGIKEGCGVGECGACTVIMNGKTVRSCLVLAVEADGAEITTIEGIAKDGELSNIQKAFVEKGAVQCGFCIPGFVTAGENLLQRKENPTREEIIEAFSGHLCRCTGYVQIMEAMESVTEDNKG